MAEAGEHGIRLMRKIAGVGGRGGWGLFSGFRVKPAGTEERRGVGVSHQSNKLIDIIVCF